MKNPNRLLFSYSIAALLVGACLLAPAFAAPGGSSLGSRELQKRSEAVEEAQELLRKGDEAYRAARYSEAVEAYAGARELVPDAPLTAGLRQGATDRYAQASVEYGRELSRRGDVPGAKAAIDKVLLPDVAPNDPAAVAFRAQLDDPIRTNPALDPAHARKVDEVRKLLYTADGHYNLGRYDQAKLTYENVIRLDPYNAAARRGLERASAAKTDYARSAYDHAREEFLSQLEGAMELPLTPLPLNPDLINPEGDDGVSGFVPISAKLSRIIVPLIDLEQSSLSEAIEFLRLQVAKSEGDEGINFTVELGASAPEVNARRFDLRLKNVPLSEILKLVTEQTKTTYTTDEFSVIIRSFGSLSETLVSRNYKVPPNFVSDLSANSTTTAPADDPFATNAAPAGGSLLAKRLNAQEALTQQGIKFPVGASAVEQNGTLRVVNTEANQDIISQIVDSVVKSESVMVEVNVTMVRVSQTNQDELSFDWLLDPVGLGSTGSAGADKLSFSGGTRGNGGDLSDLLPLTASPAAGLNPITAGNRSGDGAIGNDSIDNVIASGNDRGAVSQLRAPGILRVLGTYNGSTTTSMIRGLSQKKGVDTLTRPSTITRNGQASSIRVIRELIYPTEYEPPELPNTIGSVDIFTDAGFAGSAGNDSFPVTPSTPTAFEMRETGVILEVLPTADENKQYVDVTINPSIVDFDGFINYGSPISNNGIEVTSNDILMPVFNVKKVNTTVQIADGATIVIGGLFQQSIQNVEDRTPVFGSIPVLGRLFESKARQPTTTAIVFFVNVRLLDPTGRPFHNR